MEESPFAYVLTASQPISSTDTDLVNLPCPTYFFYLSNLSSKQPQKKGITQNTSQPAFASRVFHYRGGFG